MDTNAQHYVAAIGTDRSVLAGDFCGVTVAEADPREEVDGLTAHDMTDRVLASAETTVRHDDPAKLDRVEQAADAALAGLGFARVGPWSIASTALYADVEPTTDAAVASIATHTGALSAVAGRVEVEDAEGEWVDRVTVEPWGAEEFDFDRADAALWELGYQRLTPWHEDDGKATDTRLICRVRREVS